MKEIGRVVKKAEGLAIVEIKEGSACTKCGLCAFGKDGVITFEVPDSEEIAIGDHVEVSIPERDVIISGFLIFIAPLLIFFSGYIIKGIVLGAFLLAIYLLALYFYDRSIKALPKITRVLSNR